MKRIFTSICGIALGVVLTLSYSYLTAQPRPAGPAPKANYSGCADDDFFGLTTEDFMEGVARYKTTHSNRINSSNYMKDSGLFDARSCWYSIDTLKKFICLIEKYSRDLNIASDKLGIRFYYAVYSADPATVPHWKYRSHHTLFMIPTHKTGPYQNTDFDPRYSSEKYIPGKTNLVKYEITTLPLAVRPLMLDGVSANPLLPPDVDLEGRNQGQLCPPTCPDLTFNTLHYIDSAYKNKNINYKN